MFKDRKHLLFIIVLGLGVTSQVAQAQRATNEVHGPFSTYRAKQIAAPRFSNSDRIAQLLKEGEFNLSLRDAIELALENNLDVAIARYNLDIADTDILRAKAGAVLKGVATGPLQGTPGGQSALISQPTTGLGVGGTTTGAGGAGSGESGLVQSAAGASPPVPSYDPSISGNFMLNHATYPVSSSLFYGVSDLKQNTTAADISFNQAFSSGTSVSFDFNNSRLTSNSLFLNYNPQVGSDYRISFRQHLLHGLSPASNRRFMRIAANNKEISDVALRNQVIATVTQVENLYWDLVSATDEVRVRQRSLELANLTLTQNEARVAAGDLAPIEITRAQAEVAARRQELISARTNLEKQQLLMKNAILRDVLDRSISDAVIVPTDKLRIPDTEPVIPVQDLINDAIMRRPELVQARIDLTNRDITKRAARHALLPTVDLVGWYGGSGLAGDPITNTTSALTKSGLSDALSRSFGNDYPDYAIGVSLTIPLRNRAARADQERSEIEYRQAEMRIQQLRNLVATEVRNANFAVQQSRQQIEAAQKGQSLAAAAYDAEQKRFSVGTSTSFQLFQSQRDLIAAEAAVVAALSVYKKSAVELDRVTAMTLERNGIDIEKAGSR